MSFINMMSDDVWSEFDIIRRTEAELHSAISREDELILSRKMIGFSLGRMIPTMEEQTILSIYELAAYAAKDSGIRAREDMILLQSALDYESATRQIVSLELDDELLMPLQLLIDNSSVATLELVKLRSPPNILIDNTIKIDQIES